MASRFYLPFTGSAPISPSFDAAWERTVEAIRRPTSTTKGSTTLTEHLFLSATNADDQALAAQYVSDPIAGQTITGTVQSMIRARQSTASTNAQRAVVIRVVSGDGLTVRGTLLSMFTSTGDHFENDPEFENSSPAESRPFPESTAVSSVAAQHGDRLVFEFGATTSISGRSQYLVLGESSGTDLTSIGETTDNDPWIELSFDVVLAADVSREQKTFRHYGDGTESGSSALAAQDVDVSVDKAVTLHLRVGAQMVGDFPAESATLQYRDTGDANAEWRKLI